MLLAKATTKVSVTLESHSTHGTWLATALTSWPLVKGWSANMPSRSSAFHGDESLKNGVSDGAQVPTEPDHSTRPNRSEWAAFDFRAALV